MALMQTIENNKENYIPLKEGRSVADFATSLQQQKKNELEQKRKDWRSKLEEADESSEDPLDLWLQCLHWTEVSYPSNPEAKCSLLREITDKFKQDERYVNFPKYIDAWIKYADMQDDPSDIYNFMKSMGIGKVSATYYKSFAGFLESRSRWAEAEKVFQEGLKSVKTVETLKQAHQGFTARYVEANRAAANMSPEEIAAASAAAAENRPALQSKAAARPTTTAASASVVIAPTHGSLVPAAKLIQPSNKQLGRVAVFEDSTGVAAGAAETEWNRQAIPQPTSVAQRENIIAPTTWNVGGFGASAMPAVISKRKLEIYCDEEEPSASVPVVAPAPVAVKPSSSSSTSSSSAKTSAAAKAGTTSSSEDAFVDPVESYEESRAKVYMRRIQAMLKAKDDAERQRQAAVIETARRAAIEAAVVEQERQRQISAAAEAERARRLAAEEDARQIELQMQQSQRTPSSVVPSRPFAVLARTPSSTVPARSFASIVQPSPTINTRFAMEEIDGMFNQPLPSFAKNMLDDDDDDDDLGFLPVQPQSQQQRQQAKHAPIQVYVEEDEEDKMAEELDDDKENIGGPVASSSYGKDMPMLSEPLQAIGGTHENDPIFSTLPPLGSFDDFEVKDLVNEPPIKNSLARSIFQDENAAPSKMTIYEDDDAMDSPVPAAVPVLPASTSFASTVFQDENSRGSSGSNNVSGGGLSDGLAIDEAWDDFLKFNTKPRITRF